MLAAFYIAIVSVVYTDLLTDDGMIFSKVYNFCQQKLPEFIFKPLIGCHRCFSGQASLWFYLLNYGINIMDMIIFISTTILITETIMLCLQKLKN